MSSILFKILVADCGQPPAANFPLVISGYVSGIAVKGTSFSVYHRPETKINQRPFKLNFLKQSCSLVALLWMRIYKLEFSFNIELDNWCGMEDIFKKIDISIGKTGFIYFFHKMEVKLLPGANLLNSLSLVNVLRKKLSRTVNVLQMLC